MKRAVITTALLFAATPAGAQQLTDLASIDREVSSFTGASIGEPGGALQPVDRRLHLAQCIAPPALSWYGTGRDTVLVRCPDPGSWRIFVPLTSGAGPSSAQPAVLRGESVTIAIEGDGFSVSQPGEAVDPGTIGSWIRVRTSNANAQPFRARIVRPGLVAVDVGNGLP